MLIEYLNPDFKHEDGRGKLVQLVHNGYSQVNVIHSTAGSFRGNHYHSKNNEAFYVINGCFKLLLQKLGHSNIEEYIINAGDFFVIHKEIVHSFEFISDTTLVSMYDLGVINQDGSKDILQ